MRELNDREHELVAIGASIASNCVPCIEHHVPEARKAGLGDGQIKEAIQIADMVRRVPARKVLQAASAILEEEPPCRSISVKQTCSARSPVSSRS